MNNILSKEEIFKLMKRTDDQITRNKKVMADLESVDAKESTEYGKLMILTNLLYMELITMREKVLKDYGIFVFTEN